MLHTRLCALRAQDQLENFTNCPPLIATHNDFYASTLKNAKGSQKSRKEVFWRALCVIARAVRAGSAYKLDQLPHCNFQTWQTFQYAKDGLTEQHKSLT